MAIKTFTAGSVLTASDTNTYLANSGLVYVTSTTFTTQNYVQVNNCFSSTYDMYRVIMTTTAVSTNTNLYFQLSKSGTPTASNYYWGLTYVTNGGGTGTGQASPGTTVNPAYIGSGNAVGFQIVELLDPYNTRNTTYIITDNHNDSASQVIRTGGGTHLDATAHDGIRFGLTSPHTMSGTITVYGYRKA